MRGDDYLPWTKVYRKIDEVFKNGNIQIIIWVIPENDLISNGKLRDEKIKIGKYVCEDLERSQIVDSSK